MFNINIKNLKELGTLVSTVVLGANDITRNMVSAANHGSKALDLLAEDVEDAAEQARKFNKLIRVNRYQDKYKEFALPAELTEESSAAPA